MLIDLERDALRKRRDLRLPITEDFTLELLDALNVRYGPADVPDGLPYNRLTTALQRFRERIDARDLPDLVRSVAADLLRFAHDCAPRLPGAPADAVPILVLSDLERLVTDVDLFFANVAGEKQIGDGGTVIPIVATATCSQLIAERRRRSPRWVAFEDLRDFDVDTNEDVFAYSWVLMHPRPGFWFEPAQTQAWKFEPNEDRLAHLRSVVRSPRPEMFDGRLYDFVEGYPSFSDEEILPMYLRLQPQ